MDTGNLRNLVVHLKGESVTRPIALLPQRLAALLLLAGTNPAASSRLAMHSGKSTLGRVLLPSLE